MFQVQQLNAPTADYIDAWESLGIDPATGSIFCIIFYGVLGILFYMLLIAGVLARTSYLIIPILIYIPIIFGIELANLFLGLPVMKKITCQEPMLTIFFITSLLYKVLCMMCIFLVRRQIQDYEYNLVAQPSQP